MKLSFLLSVLMHTLLLGVLFVLPLRPRSLPRTRRVYRVELVSLPRAIEEAAEDTELRTQNRSTESSPVVPMKSSKATREPTVVVEEKVPSETGPIDSTGTADVGSSQVKVETEDFPFAYYLSLIRYRIQENWHPPYQTLGESDRMTAIVGFRVLRNGVLTDINLESSSNRFLYDQAAQRAIHAMGNLPPLPEEFGGEYLTVHIEFESVW